MVGVVVDSLSNLLYSPSFNSAYRQLPTHIRHKVDRQIQTLVSNFTHPGLRARKMIHMGGIWEARVDRHYRFTFERDGSVILLRTVGTHDIYQRP